MAELQKSARVLPRLVRTAERAAVVAQRSGAAIAARRGMPLAVAGAFVLTLAWVGERDSAWGVPMLCAGAVMIALGLVGPRLSGSVALRWGDDGAFFQFSSTIAPPGRRHRAPELESPEPGTTPGELPEKLIPPTEIEGQAETIDFKVSAAERSGETAASEESGQPASGATASGPG